MSQYQSFPDASGASRTLDKLKALKLPMLAGRSFLDVGCNEGFFCGFADFQQAGRVVGIDQSRHFIEQARRRFPRCEFLLQGWDRLPDERFDVILLASALHYADDQPALIQALVEHLSPDGVLVLELGIASSRQAEWVRVKRGIDERDFPSMPMLRQMLAGYAWKWMGPSVAQAGDPVARHVVHISRRKPVAYLLMQPPGYGKSSLASGLFPNAGVPVVSGDRVLAALARPTQAAVAISPALQALVAEDYSPFHLDQTIDRIFERGLAADLVSLWLADAGEGDVVLDAYVPAARHDEVERLLEARGYMPVQLRWNRVGLAPMPEEMLARMGEAFYLSLSRPQEDGGSGSVPVRPAGFVDELVLEDGRLSVRGWAVDAQGSLPAEIVVRVGRHACTVESLARELRPDVQQHLGLAHALVGYRFVVALPDMKYADVLARKLRIGAQDGPVFQLAGPFEAIFRRVGP